MSPNGKLRQGLLSVFSGLAAGFVAMFTISVIYVVAARQWGMAPDWGEELPRLLLVWSVFIGMVPATVNGTHFIAGESPGRIRKRLANILLIVFFALTTISGVQLTLAGLSSVSTTLQLPYAVTYAALPVGCSISILACLLRPVDSGR